MTNATTLTPSAQQPLLSRLWLAAFAGFSAFYIFQPGLLAAEWRWLFKIIPIALLLQLALTRSTGKVRTLLATGLVLSAIGDVLLALDGLFVQGLAAFLLAQITYTVLFMRQSRWQPRRLPWTALIVVYAGVSTLVIIPQASDMQIPVTAYMVAISLMAISAGFRDDARFLWVAVGALVFMVSDTLIAIDRFVSPLEHAGIAVMASYYLAQALIVIGVVRHAAVQPEPASAL